MLDYIIRSDKKYFTTKAKEINKISYYELYNELLYIVKNINENIKKFVEGLPATRIDGKQELNSLLGLNNNGKLDFLRPINYIANNGISINNFVFPDVVMSQKQGLVFLDEYNKIDILEYKKDFKNILALSNVNYDNTRLLFIQVVGQSIEDQAIIPDKLISQNTLSKSILSDFPKTFEEVFDVNNDGIKPDKVANNSIDFDKFIKLDSIKYSEYVFELFDNNSFTNISEALPKFLVKDFPGNGLNRKGYIGANYFMENTILPQHFADNCIDYRQFSNRHMVDGWLNPQYITNEKFIHGDSLAISLKTKLLYEESASFENINYINSLLVEDFTIDLAVDLPVIANHDTVFNDKHNRNYKGANINWFKKENGLRDAIIKWAEDKNIDLN